MPNVFILFRFYDLHMQHNTDYNSSTLATINEKIENISDKFVNGSKKKKDSGEMQ